MGDDALSDVVGGAPVPVVVALEPDPGAARTAREWVAATLDGWPVQSVETARLLVSELVTNAVLHARTGIALRHRIDGSRVRFEVADGRREGPMPKRYSADSPTGRGLRLIDALSTEWGVTRSADGKVVWFVVTTDSGTRDVLGTHFGSVEVPIREAPAARAPSERPTVTVQILSIPLDVYLEAEQHNDAIMRELTLLLQSSAERGGLEVPARLLEIAAEVRAKFGTAATSMREQVERAIHERRETMDLSLEVPVEGWRSLQRLAFQLEEVDRFCSTGDLLTLESTPRLRRFRRWYASQIADQVRGLPATPWPEDTGSLPL
ncbi:MAG: ATP-binding protein [Acidimicrobiales bacterium]